ncbi:MAG: DHH family phosphoesterase [Deltaproteobacteria bacterium]|nr:DHH family phosphoesterase [Deltaproteobacteria bacterium]
MDRYDEFIKDCRGAAADFLRVLKNRSLPLAIVHHNDADGIASASALTFVFDRLSLECRLLPLEKIHESILEKIHQGERQVLVYADLGGQSSHIVGRCAVNDPLVIILDHHLPGGPVPANVIHLNPETYGISGDTEASGASVSALFGIELLKEANRWSLREEAVAAALGVLGAAGDGQTEDGLTGLNRILMDRALGQGELAESAQGLTLPRLGNRTMKEIVEILNLLGSIGFYAGHSRKGIDFLHGRNPDEALRLSRDLLAMKNAFFRKERERIEKEGLQQTSRFQWVTVENRFAPMGVKSIGLFLEMLLDENLTSSSKYLIGFQHLPAVMPVLGDLGLSLTKVSSRVHKELRASIEEGKLPDFMTLIPEAAAMVGGAADGCHRYTAASLIGRNDEEKFLEALEKVLAGFTKTVD